MWRIFGFLVGSYFFGCISGYANMHLHGTFYGLVTFLLSFFLSIVSFLVFINALIAYLEGRGKS